MIDLQALAYQLNDIAGRDQFIFYVNTNLAPEEEERTVATISATEVPLSFSTNEVDAETLVLTITFDLTASDEMKRDTAIATIKSKLMGWQKFIVEQATEDGTKEYECNSFLEMQAPSAPYVDNGQITQQLVLSGNLTIVAVDSGIVIGNAVKVYFDDVELLKSSKVADMTAGEDANPRMSIGSLRPASDLVSLVNTIKLDCIYQSKPIEEEFLKIAEGGDFDANKIHTYLVAYPTFNLLKKVKLLGVTSSVIAGAFISYTLNLRLVDGEGESTGGVIGGGGSEGTGGGGSEGTGGGTGANGKSAYEIAVENGFVGSVSEWLASLKGEKGQDGKNGKDGNNGHTPVKGIDYFDGEKGEKGDKGDPGYTPQKGIDYVDGEKGDPGEDGVDGKDGQDGRGIENITINSNGELVITLTDGTVKNVGKVTADNGSSSGGTTGGGTGGGSSSGGGSDTPSGGDTTLSVYVDGVGSFIFNTADLQEQKWSEFVALATPPSAPNRPYNSETFLYTDAQGNVTAWYRYSSEEWRGKYVIVNDVDNFDEATKVNIYDGETNQYNGDDYYSYNGGYYVWNVGSIDDFANVDINSAGDKWVSAQPRMLTRKKE